MAMRNMRSTTEYECDVETFWKVFLSEDYTKKLYLDELEFKSLEILSSSETGRRMRVVPKMNMPKPVMKVLGDSFGYEEEATLDRDKNLWEWKIIPNTMANKLFTRGSIRIEAAGEGKCRRTDECTMEAKVFGVGGLIESSTEKEIRSAWDREAVFLKKYLAEQASG